MKTMVLIAVDHEKPIPHLAEMIAGRAYTIGGVSNAEVVSSSTTAQDLREAGFTLREISLGSQGS